MLRNSSLAALLLTSAWGLSPITAALCADAKPRLTISWEKRMLTISGDHLPGKEMKVLYLEAYCRAGSTDREWGKTVIRHESRLVSASPDGRVIQIRDLLTDGVVVDHTITAKHDEIDFRLTVSNPTDKASQAHWAQPCIRVGAFTGCSTEDARKLVPPYARKCFLFLDSRLTMLPTEPWADQARYIPGQVYCPASVDRDDVNPRPLSDLVPSNGLCGCYSADGKMMMAVAWEPYQEIFQGVITCIHNDFRIGGLAAGQTKQIRGKIYFVAANKSALLRRFERDFPEQTAKR